MGHNNQPIEGKHGGEEDGEGIQMWGSIRGVGCAMVREAAAVLKVGACGDRQSGRWGRAVLPYKHYPCVTHL
jgi:hypothetical protein